MDLRAALGSSGERRAAAFLKKRGYRILERNWRTALGELDIVAADRDTLVFVEVRTRASGQAATPEDSITQTKQRRLARLAEAYVMARKWPGDWRIDVVAIDEQGIRHVISAVEE